jgi:hypothetical protein
LLRVSFVSCLPSRGRSLAAAVLVLVSVASAGCHRSEIVTSRERGQTDPAGFALVHAFSAGENQHFTVEVALRGAPPGTYALLYSRSPSPPADRAWFPIAATDRGVACAISYGRGCFADEPAGSKDRHNASRQIVGAAHIGPGGAGVLRAAFDVGVGGWFTLLRVEGGSAERARYEIRIDSEAASSDEAPYRFSFEKYEAPRPAAGSSGPA